MTKHPENPPDVGESKMKNTHTTEKTPTQVNLHPMMTDGSYNISVIFATIALTTCPSNLPPACPTYLSFSFFVWPPRPVLPRVGNSEKDRQEIRRARIGMVKDVFEKKTPTQSHSKAAKPCCDYSKLRAYTS